MQDVSFAPVPAASFFCVAVSGLIAAGLPLGLAVLCCRRRRGALRAVLTGALCFFVGAMVLENLCHLLVFTLFPALPQTPVLYGLYGCLAAGLFEETARLLGLRWLCRRNDAPMTGFAYGVGHGGMEAILIAGVGAVSNLTMMAALNAGQAESILAAAPEAQRAAVQAQLEQLAALPSLVFLASGVERAITIAFHIALSMVIWMVVTRRLPGWGYPAAILLHAAMDVFAMAYQLGRISNIWLTEALVGVFTLLVCLGVGRVYRAVQARQTPPPPSL